MSVSHDRFEARHRTYEGFGEKHTAAQWAKLLGLPRNSVWRYLTNGLTIEEVCRVRGISLDGEEVEAEPLKRKARQGHQMGETTQIMTRVLTQSGFDTKTLEVRPVGSQPKHRIVLDGGPVGDYNYKTGFFVLNNKEGLPILRIGVENVRIKRHGVRWSWCPETKAQLMDRLVEYSNR